MSNFKTCKSLYLCGEGLIWIFYVWWLASLVYLLGEAQNVYQKLTNWGALLTTSQVSTLQVMSQDQIPIVCVWCRRWIQNIKCKIWDFIVSMKSKVLTLSPNLSHIQYYIAILCTQIGSRSQKSILEALLAWILHWTSIDKILAH